MFFSFGCGVYIKTDGFDLFATQLHVPTVIRHNFKITGKSLDQNYKIEVTLTTTRTQERLPQYPWMVMYKNLKPFPTCP